MAQIWVKNKRKDGKYGVNYGWDSGKRTRKIVTRDTLIREQNVNGYTINPNPWVWINPMEWPEINPA